VPLTPSWLAIIRITAPREPFSIYHNDLLVRPTSYRSEALAASISLFVRLSLYARLSSPITRAQ
jgi:hypothetical protein